MRTALRLLSICCIVLLIGATLTYASDGISGLLNTPIAITGPDAVCKKVTNASPTGLSAYIPTASTAEWQSFVVNPPNGVAIGACGLTWTQRFASSTTWRSIAMSADGVKMVAVPSNGVVYTSADSGVTWVPRNASGTHKWLAVASSQDGTKIVAVAGVPTDNIYTSSDSGVTWVARTAAGLRNWNGVAMSSDGLKIAAVAFGGLIYTSADGGVTWTARSGAGTRNWYSITSSSDGVKLAAVDQTPGLIYTSTDSGATWVARSGAGSRQWWGIASSANGTQLIATTAVTAGFFYTSNDSGATWTQHAELGSQFWGLPSTMPDASTTVLPGYNSSIFLSKDSFVTWAAESSPGVGTWAASAISSDGHIIAVVKTGAIWIGM